jgi:hypothetical protein
MAGEASKETYKIHYKSTPAKPTPRLPIIPIG